MIGHLTRTIGAIALLVLPLLGPSGAVTPPALAISEQAPGVQHPSELIDEPFPGRDFDPETFDLRTMTDTEVRRGRAALLIDVASANLDHALAAISLNQHDVDLRARLEQHSRADNALRHLEEVIVARTVSGFMTYQVDRPAAVPMPPIDAVADESRADFATNRLTRDRAEATDHLAATELAVEEAQRSLDQAETRHLETSRVLRAARQRLAAFDERVIKHRQLSLQADQRAATRSATIELRSVAGTLIVNSAIEADIDRLIADARRDGHDLGGGGYRSEEAQILLRLANCDRTHDSAEESAHPEGATEDADHRRYIAFEVPASSCAPPTARPGESEHQAGLALDLTENGAILTAASPAFQWMTRNGHAYGLANLPGEPWHWSTTGH